MYSFIGCYHKLFAVGKNSNKETELLLLLLLLYKNSRLLGGGERNFPRY
jgi:hypothetical protein